MGVLPTQPRGGRRAARALAVNVLFVCVQNAGRSQMAEALYGRERRSAGSNPADGVHPEVVEVDAREGIDLSGPRPAGARPFRRGVGRRRRDDGLRRRLSVHPGKRYVDWQLDDPAGKPLDEVRAVRDEIERRLAEL